MRGTTGILGAVGVVTGAFALVSDGAGAVGSATVCLHYLMLIALFATPSDTVAAIVVRTVEQKLGISIPEEER